MCFFVRWDILDIYLVFPAFGGVVALAHLCFIGPLMPQGTVSTVIWLPLMPQALTPPLNREFIAAQGNLQALVSDEIADVGVFAVWLGPYFGNPSPVSWMTLEILLWSHRLSASVVFTIMVCISNSGYFPERYACHDLITPTQSADWMVGCMLYIWYSEKYHCRTASATAVSGLCVVLGTRLSVRVSGVWVSLGTNLEAIIFS